MKQWIHDFLYSLKHSGLKPSQVISGYQRLTGYSRGHLYRIAKKYGWNSARKEILHGE